MRAAVVIEQCWHRVPGGTATATLDQVAAVAATGRVDQVGVAARHREPPPEAWRPSIPVRHLPLPRLALYRTWHRLRCPAVERATGPVDVVHATGYAIPPRTAPLVVTMHDLAWRRDPSMFTRNGVRFFEAGLRCVLDDADLVLCPSRATLEDCVAAGIGRARLRHVPWGMTAADVTDDEVARPCAARFGLTGPLRAVGRHARAPQEPARACSRRSPGCPTATSRWWSSGPTGGATRPRRGRRAPGRPAAVHGLRPPTQLAPLYGGASVVCYPSLWEGYGLPVAEAMGAGAPVVTSAGTATEELVAGGAGLAVDPYDVDAIAGGARLGPRRRRPGRPPAGGRAGAGRGHHLGGPPPRRRSPPTRRCWGREGAGATCCGSCPGSVGGTETATVALLREIAAGAARRHRADALRPRRVRPDLPRPGRGVPHPPGAASPGGCAALRVVAENSWLAQQAQGRGRPGPPHGRRAPAGAGGARASSRSTTCSRSTCPRTSPPPSGPTCSGPSPGRVRAGGRR